MGFVALFGDVGVTDAFEEGVSTLFLPPEAAADTTGLGGDGGDGIGAGVGDGAGVGGGVGVGVGGVGEAVPVCRFGIAPNDRVNVERCAGSGKAVGLGKVKVALAGVVAVAGCTLSRDFAWMFMFVMVV